MFNLRGASLRVLSHQHLSPSVQEFFVSRKNLLLTYVTFRTFDSTKVGRINHIAKKLDHYFLAENVFLFADFQLVKVQFNTVSLL